ncbi:MAG: hypothetical protein ACREBS_09320 [Nitrososphaerales archaeon]
MLTSHAWENARIELSHQDTTISEAMLAESSEVSRVSFPPYYDATVMVVQNVYRSHGQFWTLAITQEGRGY